LTFYNSLLQNRHLKNDLVNKQKTVIKFKVFISQQAYSIPQTKASSKAGQICSISNRLFSKCLFKRL